MDARLQELVASLELLVLALDRFNPVDDRLQARLQRLRLLNHMQPRLFAQLVQFCAASSW